MHCGCEVATVASSEPGEAKAFGLLPFENNIHMLHHMLLFLGKKKLLHSLLTGKLSLVEFRRLM